MKRNSGFTLIELMIVVAIVGILAAIAYPSYREHILKTRRSDGQAFLLDVAARQERFFFDNGSYAADTAALSLANPAVTPEGYYSVTIKGADAACPIASCYVATATAQNGQEDDKCGNLILHSTGKKERSGSGDCW